MPDLDKLYEGKLLTTIAQNNGRILDVYHEAINKIAFTASTLSLGGSNFAISLYPKLQKTVNSLLESMHSDIYALSLNGIKDGWKLSNGKNNLIVDKRLQEGPANALADKILYDPNLDALNKFIARKEQGLNLSKRVWNSLDPFPEELTKGLALGISKGQSANEMASDLKKYLNKPDMLFRRIQDAQGKLQLSKAALKYHPGQGVYRSSFKNARRLAATETNIAYRTSDYDRWQAMPFVTGIEIHTSKNHPEYDICDELKGEYPKDFKFTGWHPHCLCYATAIQMTDDEYNKFEDAILNGENQNNNSSTKVTQPPDAFKNYIDKNSNRIAGYANDPSYIKNNPKYVSFNGKNYAASGIKKALPDETINVPVPAQPPTASTYEEALKQMKSYSPTADQAETTRAYTEEMAAKMNRELRKTSDQELDAFFKLTKFTSDIDGFLQNAPKYTGESYRGMQFEDQAEYLDFINNISVGGILKDNAYMSTSADLKAADNFTGYHEAFTAMITVDGKTGVALGDFSSHVKESEVLFGRGSEFEVTSFTEDVTEYKGSLRGGYRSKTRLNIHVREK